MSRRPTVYDVAERAGVSITTVSFAFRQPTKIRPATREAVMAAARELGYVASASARGLAEGATGAFGMYAFDLMLAERTRASDEDLLSNPGQRLDPRLFPLYVDEVERGFALECRADGRVLLLASGAAGGATMYDIAGRVDGLATFPGPHQPDALHQIARRIPVVVFNTPVAQDDPYGHIDVDNRVGVRALVEHLVHEHRVTDLAFVGDLSMHEFQERLEGFREVRAQLVPDAGPDTDERTALAGTGWHDALTALVAADRLPRGLVCQNDQQALDVLDLLAAHDVPVPERTVVTGFDGILAGQLASPTLTTVRQPLESMGRLAARLLARQLADPGSAPERHVLPLQPLFRRSCGCPD